MGRIDPYGSQMAVSGVLGRCILIKGRKYSESYH